MKTKLIVLLVLILFATLFTLEAKSYVLVHIYRVLDGEEVGSASFRKRNSALVVNISVSPIGIGPNGALLQEGTCQNPGKIIYYLTKLYDGKSSSTTNIDPSLLAEKKSLILSLYEPEDYSGRVVYCGDISPASFRRFASFAKSILPERYSLVVEAQPISRTIRVKEAFLAKGGFLAVFDAEEALLTRSDYLPPGTYQNIEVGFFGESEESRSLGDRFIVVLYKDNGDKHFDVGLDVPATDFSGKIIEEYAFFR